MKYLVITRAWIVVSVAAVLTGVLVSDVWADEPCKVGQFRGEYSKDGTRVFAKCDKAINFDWSKEGPKADPKADGTTELGVGHDNYSVEWTGRIDLIGGKYTFIVVADDGVVLRVDGQKLIDKWKSQPATEFRATTNLTPGEHVVVVNYFQDKDDAIIRVHWERLGP